MRLDKLRKCTSRTKSYYYDSHVENTKQNKQKTWPLTAKNNLDVKFGNVYLIIICIFFLMIPY